MQKPIHYEWDRWNKILDAHPEIGQGWHPMYSQYWHIEREKNKILFQVGYCYTDETGEHKSVFDEQTVTMYDEKTTKNSWREECDLDPIRMLESYVDSILYFNWNEKIHDYMNKDLLDAALLYDRKLNKANAIKHAKEILKKTKKIRKR
jgi:hypothetical protein